MSQKLRTYQLFIIFAALCDAQKEVADFRTANNVLEDEKKLQAQGTISSFIEQVLNILKCLLVFAFWWYDSNFYSVSALKEANNDRTALKMRLEELSPYGQGKL